MYDVARDSSMSNDCKHYIHVYAMQSCEVKVRVRATSDPSLALAVTGTREMRDSPLCCQAGSFRPLSRFQTSMHSTSLESESASIVVPERGQYVP